MSHPLGTMVKLAGLILLGPVVLSWALQACANATPDLPAPGAEAAEKARKAKVIGAVDGDTLLVDVGDQERYVRLIGLDTPETVRPGVAVECGGPEASESMKALAAAGSEVKLVADRSQDRIDGYGRLLAYAEISGRDVGEIQVRRGWAEPYVYEETFGRLSDYQQAAAKAEVGGAGAWGSCGGDFHSEGS